MQNIHIGHLPTNLVADTDTYKQGHPPLMNPGLTHLETYAEARLGAKYGYSAWFGLQALVAREFMTPVTKQDIERASDHAASVIGVNPVDVAAWEHVINKHGGYLPMTIKSMPEGSLIKPGNALFTTVCNDPKFAKIMNSIETIQMQVWKPVSVLTRAARIKSRLYPLVLQSGSIEMLDFMVNDFGLRGTTCLSDGGISGMAALVAFAGSDNNRAGRELAAYYGGSGRQKSVYATEHSVALSYGRNEGELAYLKHVLTAIDPNMIISVVIDTYDPHGFIRNVACHPEIVELIKNRPGRVVFRPDSGIPEMIVSQVLELLNETYGYHYNHKGYKVLNHNIGIIQGDGMNEDSIIDLYVHIIKLGWSSDNLVVGSGGGLLTVGLNRDTQRFAIKPSYGIIDGQPTNFKKNPATDPTKASKAGKIKVHGYTPNSFMTITSADTSKEMFDAYADTLRVLYHNGEIYPEHFDQIKNRFDDHLRQVGTF